MEWSHLNHTTTKKKRKGETKLKWKTTFYTKAMREEFLAAPVPVQTKYRVESIWSSNAQRTE